MVRQFAVMTVVWGVVGMLVGVIIAAQLTFPDFLGGIPWLSYGRLRPLHTNAVIFAFGGSALFATSYYVVQRTCHAPLFAPGLAAFTFWGWTLVIVLAAITLPNLLLAGALMRWVNRHDAGALLRRAGGMLVLAFGIAGLAHAGANSQPLAAFGTWLCFGAPWP